MSPDYWNKKHIEDRHIIKVSPAPGLDPMVIVMEDPLDTFHIALGLHRQKLPAKEKDKKTAMILDGKYTAYKTILSYKLLYTRISIN